MDAVIDFLNGEIRKGDVAIGGPVQAAHIDAKGRFEWKGKKPDVCQSEH